jgi:hypothetical protein
MENRKKCGRTMWATTMYSLFQAFVLLQAPVGGVKHASRLGDDLSFGNLQIPDIEMAMRVARKNGCVVVDLGITGTGFPLFFRPKDRFAATLQELREDGYAFQPYVQIDPQRLRTLQLKTPKTPAQFVDDKPSGSFLAEAIQHLISWHAFGKGDRISSIDYVEVPWLSKSFHYSRRLTGNIHIASKEINEPVPLEYGPEDDAAPQLYKILDDIRTGVFEQEMEGVFKHRKHKHTSN